MIKVIKLFSIAFLGAMLLNSCEEKGDCAYKPENVGPPVDIEIERLESRILNMAEPTEIREFIRQEPMIAEVFLRRSDYPDDDVFVTELMNRFSNPHIDTLEMEIDRVFGDISALEEELEGAFTLMKYYYPGFKVPKVKTVATGFDYDLHLTDSVIVIGLDFYLGPDAKYRPQGMYNYILKRYDTRFIVPSIMLLYGISSEFNKYDPEDGTVLADMISYGKSYYFAKRMLPCVADSTLIWYDTEEITGVNQNDEIVWAHFIEKDLLFETDQFIKKKYIDDRPKTYEIGPACPPRVGTWLGWQIINKYMQEYPETTLTEVMEMTNARDIFQRSNYRPD